MMKTTRPSTTELRAFIARMTPRRYNLADFNCWHLFEAAQRELYGRACLPLGPSMPADREGALSAGAEQWGWSEAEQPRDGDAVLMSRLRAGPREHVGVFVGHYRRVLHSDEWHGVVLDSLADLKHLRLWYPRFYRPAQ